MLGSINLTKALVRVFYRFRSVLTYHACSYRRTGIAQVTVVAIDLGGRCKPLKIKDARASDAPA